eukprot:GHRQ01013111.1.p1 GENE.GHRQ01013111.1~~GHRQ01013111.1.p1  ORF type:complete len:109 (+),score=18.15 GHRQ01013111.1:79-405(+)
MALLQRTSTINLARKQTGQAKRAVRTQALFGWGKKDEAQEYKDYEKEEMFRAQQEMLEARRSGKALEGANMRRKQVAETVASRKAARRAEREALGRGEMPDSLKEWRG